MRLLSEHSGARVSDLAGRAGTRPAW